MGGGGVVVNWNTKQCGISVDRFSREISEDGAVLGSAASGGWLYL